MINLNTETLIVIGYYHALPALSIYWQDRLNYKTTVDGYSIDFIAQELQEDFKKRAPAAIYNATQKAGQGELINWFTVALSFDIYGIFEGAEWLQKDRPALDPGALLPSKFFNEYRVKGENLK